MRTESPRQLRLRLEEDPIGRRLPERKRRRALRLLARLLAEIVEAERGGEEGRDDG